MEINSFINQAPSFISPAEKDPLCPAAGGPIQSPQDGQSAFLRAPDLRTSGAFFANSTHLQKLRYSHGHMDVWSGFDMKNIFFIHTIPQI